MPSAGRVTIIDTGTPRDQGNRPTCLSFALSDVHRSMLGWTQHLSPEALHRAAAVRGKHAITAAVTDVSALNALKHDGQPSEAKWPYHSSECLDPLAMYYKRSGLREAFDVGRVLGWLASGIPIVLILDIGIEFFLCSEGSILEQQHIEQAEACHAVVITGIYEKNSVHYLRLKNSWGEAWGDGGYVWASAPYISRRSPFIVRIL